MSSETNSKESALVTRLRPVPEITAYRLSLYHCYLGELLDSDPDARITSSVLAGELDLREESVRRDISFVGSVGTPGAGYVAAELKAAIEAFLGLSSTYPVIRVGSRGMLEALNVVFPSDAWGIRVAGYFSENPEDSGAELNGIRIHHISELPSVVQGNGVEVALVACAAEWVQTVIDRCGEAGIKGVLLLTPKLGLRRPEEMHITQIRMPCDIKSLACRCAVGAQAPE